MVYDVQLEFIMSNLNRKITGLAVATLLATGLTACKEEKVEAQPMEQGYQNAEPAQPATAEPNQATATATDTKTTEGQCGEGKCGEAGCSATMTEKSAEGKCGEGKCGAEAKAGDKSANAGCGANTATATADKSATASCGASTDKNANASCGGNK